MGVGLIILGSYQSFGQEDLTQELLGSAAVTTAPAEIRAPEPQPAAARPAKLLEARISWSDGTQLTGELHPMSSRPLRIWIAKLKVYRDLQWSWLERLSVEIESDIKEPNWRWVREGSDEKVIAPGGHRRVRLITRLKLSNGEELSGTLTEGLELAVPKSPVREILLKTQFDLPIDSPLPVYPNRIEILNAPPAPSGELDRTELPLIQ